MVLGRPTATPVYGQPPGDAEGAEPDGRVGFGKLFGPLHSQTGFVRYVLEQAKAG